MDVREYVKNQFRAGINQFRKWADRPYTTRETSRDLPTLAEQIENSPAPNIYGNAQGLLGRTQAKKDQASQNYFYTHTNRYNKLQLPHFSELAAIGANAHTPMQRPISDNLNAQKAQRAAIDQRRYDEAVDRALNQLYNQRNLTRPDSGTQYEHYQSLQKQFRDSHKGSYDPNGKKNLLVDLDDTVFHTQGNRFYSGNTAAHSYKDIFGNRNQRVIQPTLNAIQAAMKSGWNVSAITSRITDQKFQDKLNKLIGGNVPIVNVGTKYDRVKLHPRDIAQRKLNFIESIKNRGQTVFLDDNTANIDKIRQANLPGVSTVQVGQKGYIDQLDALFPGSNPKSSYRQLKETVLNEQEWREGLAAGRYTKPITSLDLENDQVMRQALGGDGKGHRKSRVYADRIIRGVAAKNMVWDNQAMMLRQLGPAYNKNFSTSEDQQWDYRNRHSLYTDKKGNELYMPNWGSEEFRKQSADELLKFATQYNDPGDTGFNIMGQNVNTDIRKLIEQGYGISSGSIKGTFDTMYNHALMRGALDRPLGKTNWRRDGYDKDIDDEQYFEKSSHVNLGKMNMDNNADNIASGNMDSLAAGSHDQMVDVDQTNNVAETQIKKSSRMMRLFQKIVGGKKAADGRYYDSRKVFMGARKKKSMWGNLRSTLKNIFRHSNEYSMQNIDGQMVPVRNITQNKAAPISQSIDGVPLQELMGAEQKYDPEEGSPVAADFADLDIRSNGGSSIGRTPGESQEVYNNMAANAQYAYDTALAKKTDLEARLAAEDRRTGYGDTVTKLSEEDQITRDSYRNRISQAEAEIADARKRKDEAKTETEQWNMLRIRPALSTWKSAYRKALFEPGGKERRRELEKFVHAVPDASGKYGFAFKDGGVDQFIENERLNKEANNIWGNWQSQLKNENRSASQQGRLYERTQLRALKLKPDQASALMDKYEAGEIKNRIDLERATQDVTKSERDLMQTRRQASATNKQFKQYISPVKGLLGKFGDTEGEWYDWTRWNRTRHQQWGGITGAMSGFVPKALQSPISRIGQAYLTGIDASSQRNIRRQGQFMKGTIPMLAGGLGVLGGGGLIAGGIAATMTGAGAGVGIPMIIKGSALALGGIASGAMGYTQRKGIAGETSIAEKGYAWQTKLNLVSAGVELFKSVHSVIHRMIMAPFKLLGSVFKWGIPIVTGFIGALSSWTGKQISQTEKFFGRPLLTYTGDMTTARGRNKAWYDNMRSRGGDIRVGLEQGSMQSMMVEMAQTRERLYNMGDADYGGITASALLGMFNQMYEKVDPSQRWGHFNEIIATMIDKMRADGGARATDVMTLASKIDPKFAQILQAIYETGDTRIRSVEHLISDPRHSGALGSNINYITTRFGTPAQFRKVEGEYESVKMAQGINKMIVANNVWNAVGFKIEKWWVGLWERIANATDGNKMTGTWKNVVAYVVDSALELGGKLKEIISEVFSDIGIKTVSIGALIKTVFGKLKESGILEGAIHMYTSAWIKIAAIGYEIINSLAETIWDKFYHIIDKFTDMRINLRALLPGSKESFIEWRSIDQEKVKKNLSDKTLGATTMLTSIDKQNNRSLGWHSNFSKAWNDYASYITKEYGIDMDYQSMQAQRDLEKRIKTGKILPSDVFLAEFVGAIEQWGAERLAGSNAEDIWRRIGSGAAAYIRDPNNPIDLSGDVTKVGTNTGKWIMSPYIARPDEVGPLGPIAGQPVRQYIRNKETFADAIHDRGSELKGAFGKLLDKRPKSGEEFASFLEEKVQPLADAALGKGVAAGVDFLAESIDALVNTLSNDPTIKKILESLKTTANKVRDLAKDKEAEQQKNAIEAVQTTYRLRDITLYGNVLKRAGVGD